MAMCIVGGDARRRDGSKTRLVSHLQHSRALLPAQRMAGHGSYRLRPAIALYEPGVRLSALQGALVDACDLTGLLFRPRRGLCAAVHVRVP